MVVFPLAMQRPRHGKGRRYIHTRTNILNMSSRLHVEQVLASLEDSFRGNLPAELTSESSLLRLTEVKHNSRKKKPATSANFKKVCESTHIMYIDQNQLMITCYVHVQISLTTKQKNRQHLIKVAQRNALNVK